MLQFVPPFLRAATPPGRRQQQHLLFLLSSFLLALSFTLRICKHFSPYCLHLLLAICKHFSCLYLDLEKESASIFLLRIIFRLRICKPCCFSLRQTHDSLGGKTLIALLSGKAPSRTAETQVPTDKRRENGTAFPWLSLGFRLAFAWLSRQGKAKGKPSESQGKAKRKPSESQEGKDRTQVPREGPHRRYRGKARSPEGMYFVHS